MPVFGETSREGFRCALNPKSKKDPGDVCGTMWSPIQCFATLSFLRTVLWSLTTFQMVTSLTGFARRNPVLWCYHYRDDIGFDIVIGVSSPHLNRVLAGFPHVV